MRYWSEWGRTRTRAHPITSPTPPQAPGTGEGWWARPSTPAIPTTPWCKSAPSSCPLPAHTTRAEIHHGARNMWVLGCRDPRTKARAHRERTWRGSSNETELAYTRQRVGGIRSRGGFASADAVRNFRVRLRFLHLQPADCSRSRGRALRFLADLRLFHHDSVQHLFDGGRERSGLWRPVGEWDSRRLRPGHHQRRGDDDDEQWGAGYGDSFSDEFYGRYPDQDVQP